MEGKHTGEEACLYMSQFLSVHGHCSISDNCMMLFITMKLIRLNLYTVMFLNFQTDRSGQTV